MDRTNIIKRKKELYTIDALSLSNQDFPDRKAIVEEILFPGMYIFAGDAKIGKSLLILSMAIAISSGKDFWNRRTRKGTVLYLSLEDGLARLQERLTDMTSDYSPNLFLTPTASCIGHGLEEQINDFMEKHEDCNTIIVDTLERVRSEKDMNNGSYSADYKFIEKLKDMADSYDIAVIVIHHVRKMEAKNPFDKISGTNGLFGASDGSYILEKEKMTDNRAKLHIVGRDIKNACFTLEFDEKNVSWNLIDDKDCNLGFLEKILVAEIKLLAKDSKQNFTASEICKIINSKHADLSFNPNSVGRKIRNISRFLLREENTVVDTYRTSSERIISIGTKNDGYDKNDDISTQPASNVKYRHQ